MESFAEAAAVRVAVRVVAGCGGASPSSIASASVVAGCGGASPSSIA